MRRMTFAILNVVFVLAAVLAWPIYQDLSYVILVTVSLVLANLVAFVSLQRSLRIRSTTIMTAATYLVLGVPLAVPSALASPQAFLSGVLSLVTAPVTGWKDLLTLTLPVGSYQTVLIPAFLLFFVLSVVTLMIALTAKTVWWIAAATALIPMVFAATFGSSATSASVGMLWFTMPAPREILLTLTSVLLMMLWLSRRRNSATQMQRSRWSTSAVVVTVSAMVLAIVIAPAMMAQVPRNVLRAQIDPQLKIDQQTSPLSLYRQAFQNELFNTELFQVSQGGSAERIRIATLTGFDGQVATVSADSSGNTIAQDSSFARVPALVDSATSQGSPSMKIGALRGIWMPTIANLAAVSFGDPRPEALADGFFYNEGLQAGIQLADGGLKNGDSYRLEPAAQGGEAEQGVELASLQPGLSQPRINPDYVPESLQDWLAMQKVSRSGEGLETLITRLRARGYLSHALSIDAASPPLWMAQIPGYDFQPSRAGHSSARIDQLFTDLRDRQREVGAVSDEQLVAAVGDDEQFSVAALLLADQLGFNARIVLGTRLVGDTGQGIQPCTAGACDGSTLTAWLEVQGDTGEWVAVDVTPQHEHPIAPEVDRLQDPQVVTEVQPPAVDSVQPPEAAPSQSEAQSPDSPAADLDLTWLWETLRVISLSLLLAVILFGPFVLIWVLKRLRRGARKRGPEPKDMILGAWNEYVDTAVDFGQPIPQNETRLELVQRYSANQASVDDLTLAEIADRAVFSERVADAAQSAAAWQLVDARTRALRAQTNRRQQLTAAISLRSFWRWARGEKR